MKNWLRRLSKMRRERAQQPPLDPATEKLVSASAFEITRFEPRASLGNVLLDIRRGALLLRFATDRSGLSYCDIGSADAPDTWIGYEAILPTLNIERKPIPNDSLKSAINHVLAPENRDVLNRLEPMLNRDAFLSLQADTIRRAKEKWLTSHPQN